MQTVAQLKDEITLNQRIIERRQPYHAEVTRRIDTAPADEARVRTVREAEGTASSWAVGRTSSPVDRRKPRPATSGEPRELVRPSGEAPPQFVDFGHGLPTRAAKAK